MSMKQDGNFDEISLIEDYCLMGQRHTVAERILRVENPGCVRLNVIIETDRLCPATTRRTDDETACLVIDTYDACVHTAVGVRRA